MPKRKKPDSRPIYYPYPKWNCIRRVYYKNKLYDYEDFVILMHITCPYSINYNDLDLVDFVGAEWVLG